MRHFPFCDRNQFKALIFDWDGVLVDSAENYGRAYQMIFREAGIEVTRREIYLLEGRPTPQLIATVFAEHQIFVTDDQARDMAERRRAYDAALGPREFFPRVRELLDRLHDEKYKLALVTGSSRQSVESILRRHRENWFDVVVTADDVARPKPDSQPFSLAAQRLGVAPGDCLVVENAPLGIEAARLAGCRSVGICTTLTADDLRGADWIVHNHEELTALLSSQVELIPQIPGR